MNLDNNDHGSVSDNGIGYVEPMILVVCTGNLHRSPLLEAILKLHGFPAVASAGLSSPGGAVPPLMRKAAFEAGLDLREHESRQLEQEQLARARIVICMQRDHIAQLAVLDATAFRKTLMLREAVQIMSVHPPHEGVSLESWLKTAIGSRRAADVLRAPIEWDTPDPIGGTIEDFRNAVSDICRSAESLVKGLSVLIRRND